MRNYWCKKWGKRGFGCGFDTDYVFNKCAVN